MTRFSSSSSFFTLAILLAQTLSTSATPLSIPRNADDKIAYLSGEKNGNLLGYRLDGSVVGPVPHGVSLQARQSSGCKLMSIDEAKSRSYNLGNEYEGSAALVCVDNKPAVLYADATPSCSSRESSTGGQLVGISGQVTISYTQGYSTSVTESTMLGSSLTANVGFKFFDLLDVGASMTTTTQVTNTVSEGFTVTESSSETQSITMQAQEGKYCQLRFSNRSCNVRGSGQVRYISSGCFWFNYNDETEGHYRWAVNIEAIVPDLNRRSATATVRGMVSGDSTSDYQGSCE
ncbi:hypothetical protein BDV98DRAFT_587065 [Pterulicium gracile]|uniref:Uncharacterized protein n=1 Tax=Pterulicium gracile TaxID=1884261 RepID=A0A5C3Q352_9AGAR|nr:hypothetical protein BDV98DRAFT_587065 [Pterula gracilis]